MRALTDEIVQAEEHAAGCIVIDIRDDLLVMFDRGHLNQIVVEPRAQRLAALPEEGRQHPHRRARRLHGRRGHLRARATTARASRPSSAAQIFEPFFTTRPGGTGLGLYIARELADANGAALELLPKIAGRACSG